MGSMEDLIAFLRIRLDEDERIARRVKGAWRLDGDTGVILASDGTHAEPCAAAYWGGIPEHIVRHDPARVLREVEAKRRIIEHNTCLHQMADPATHPDQEYVLAAGASDRVLRLLALPYADHRDYREEWRA